MAIEKQGYTPFPLPITGPVTSKAFPMDAASQGANITLGGSSFSVRVQVSNATNPGPGPDHLFIPPDASFDTSKTLTASDPPQQIAGPVRYIRLILDSGTLTGANIEQNTRGSLPLDTLALSQLASTAGTAAGTAAGSAAGTAAARAALLPVQTGSGYASFQAALTDAAVNTVQDVTGSTPGTLSPNAQLARVTATQTAAGGASALLLADQRSGTPVDETAFTTGRTSRIIQGLNLVSDGTGVGITVGDPANFWSGAIKTVRDSYFRGFQTAIAIKSNSYMLNFDSGTITQGPAGSYGVANDPASVNYGENVTFKNFYFFNNAGTCVQFVGGGYGQQLKFVDCSFDYSALAVVVKTGARVILDRCWIETNATTTPAEYLRAEGGGQLLLVDCDFVIGGDWTGRVGFIRNVNAEVVIRGGRLGFSGTPPVQFINDESGGVSTVTGLRYSPSTQARGRFGQSGTLVSTADATLSGAATLGSGNITFAPAGGTAQAVWTVPAQPGQMVRFAFKYATSALTVGAQAYMLLSGSLGWYDAAGVQIGSNSQILGLHGGTQATIEAPPEPDMPQIAPPRARSARITLTASGAASGTATLSSVECWVL